jgi:hypothetical protein
MLKHQNPFKDKWKVRPAEVFYVKLEYGNYDGEH